MGSHLLMLGLHQLVISVNTLFASLQAAANYPCLLAIKGAGLREEEEEEGTT
jgi:hypothetical protein